MSYIVCSIIYLLLSSQQDVQRFSDNDKLYLYLQLPAGPGPGDKRYLSTGVQDSRSLQVYTGLYRSIQVYIGLYRSIQVYIGPLWTGSGDNRYWSIGL